MSAALALNNRERTIDALARNQNIIRSLFHYKKPITFLIISLSIQKIKINAHKGGLVVISKEEVVSLATGNDLKIGINNLINLVRKDIESNNFFNFYSPSSGLKDIRKGLVRETAITKDMFEDLSIDFDESLFDEFKTKNNYTIQSLNQLRACDGNQITMIYTLTQPYAKSKKPLRINIIDLRFYLRISDDAYTAPKSLTMRVKNICVQITKKTDINLTVISIKSSNKTVGYQFQSEFKKPKNSIKKISEVKEKPKLSIRQQLTNWGVSVKQIDLWTANLNTKTINDAIEQTLNRPMTKNTKTNPGGYIYRILGDGKQLQLAVQIKTDEVIGCLRNFGLTDKDIESAKNQLKNDAVLTALTNECLRKLADEALGTDNMIKFFKNKLVDCVGQLNGYKK